MRQLLACTVCFNTNVKLFHLDYHGLRPAYHWISGLKTHKQNGLPQYVCVECAAIIRKITKFRDKCQRAYYTLQQIQNEKNYITVADLECIDKNIINVTPLLSFMDLTRCHYEHTEFKCVKMNSVNIIDFKVPVFTCSTTEDQEFITINQELSESKEENEALPPLDVKVEDASGLDEGLDQSEDYNQDEEKAEKVEININDINIQEIDGPESDNKNYEDHKINDIDYTSDEDQVMSQDVNKEEEEGSNLDEEYGTMVALTKPEICATMEIAKLTGKGSKFRCKVCSKGFSYEDRLKHHERIHDVHTRGLFECQFCLYRYKTDYLLKTHLGDKHMFKYICKKCPEVTFDRRSAKQHFIWAHMDKRTNVENWEENRPKWLITPGGPRNRGVVFVKPKKKMNKLPKDFLKLVPIEHNEQYTLILERKKSRNYIEAPFKCEYCYRGFRATGTFNNHMKKHDPEISGKYQCDMCKLYLQHPCKMYKHMISMHLYKYCCQRCNYICYNRNQAYSHYRWHNNVMYKCPHCPKEFKKLSTRITHIRVKHPSNCICNLCGHSFVSDTGLNSHKRYAHKDEPEEKVPTINKDDPLYCSDCNVLFANDDAFTTHLGSSSKHASINKSVTKVRGPDYKRRSSKRPRARPPVNTHIVNIGEITATNCEYCGDKLTNDVQARKHYQQAHPGKDYLKRYMCDVCGHTTRLYGNLLTHLRTHTGEKPYACPHCEKKFNMPNTRDNHILIHTGEKRYECHHCNKRFTQRISMKLHIQTVHLKIPYEPWVRSKRKRKWKDTDFPTDAAFEVPTKT